ncbi:MAG TPA: YceI family protein [Gaiellaceae bacterium]|jgi:polyisoprenoid-binding protein YceI
MTAVQTESRIPTGAWALDGVHSRIGFAVRHLGVSWFRGSFGSIEGTLDGDGLAGSAEVASIAVDEPALKGHLLSPDFFDVERHPRLTFRAGDLRVDGDGAVTVSGEITIKGVTRPITLGGTVRGPVENAYGKTVLGLELEGTVDRREFGLDWNAPLPGGGLTVANEVRLTGELELVRVED